MKMRKLVWVPSVAIFNPKKAASPVRRTTIPKHPRCRNVQRRWLTRVNPRMKFGSSSKSIRSPTTRHGLNELYARRMSITLIPEVQVCWKGTWEGNIEIFLINLLKTSSQEKTHRVRIWISLLCRLSLRYYTLLNRLQPLSKLLWNGLSKLTSPFLHVNQKLFRQMCSSLNLKAPHNGIIKLQRLLTKEYIATKFKPKSSV